MLGLFHATGLGGIEEDQGLVSVQRNLSLNNPVLVTLHLFRLARVSSGRDGDGISTLVRHQCQRGLHDRSGLLRRGSGEG